VEKQYELLYHPVVPENFLCLHHTAVRPMMLPRGTIVRVMGTLDYDTALALQHHERTRVLRGEIPGTVLLLEHDPPVITLGRRADGRNLLESEESLIQRGYQVRRVERGGDVTVHEPGQVVVYFLLPVGSKTAGPFLEGILGLASDFLREHYHIEARYDAARPGLWAEGKKLCAAGLDLTGGISMHGIAINVSNSMVGFTLVVPCGIGGSTVTSLSALLGRRIDAGEFMEAFAEKLERLAR
jgi:lipoate-protein ligase B